MGRACSLCGHWTCCAEARLQTAARLCQNGWVSDRQISIIDHYRALRRVVNGIEQQLHRTDLWEADPPSDEALSSEQPFSYDTMLFHQWLQWLFIPRMRTILAGHGHLPTESAIFPYATDCLAECCKDPGELLFLIQTFDELISGPSPSDHCH